MCRARALLVGVRSSVVDGTTTTASHQTDEDAEANKSHQGRPFAVRSAATTRGANDVLRCGIADRNGVNVAAGG